ncbi:MAG: hypothetical protein SGJ27_04685 [Candidatus Melainabacteria bacterium]|nr:hypothetical protein [Candidatus Melainabacteria bacterium]
MKNSHFSLAIAIAFTAANSLLCSDAATAAPIKVVKGASTAGIDARIKTDALGKIKVNNGSVKFSGNDVTVGAVPDWLFDRHVVLTGKLIDSRISSSASGTVIQGLMYFTGGDWINSFEDFKRPDNLELTDGSTLVGKVRAVNPSNIDFQVQTGQTRRVNLTDVKTIFSPRAYSFSIPATDVKVDAATGDMTGEASLGSFDSSLTKDARKLFAKKDPKAVEPKSTLAGSEGGVTKGQLTTMIVLDVVNTIAPAIVAPIVAPLGSRSAVNQLRQTEIQTQRESFSR